jgi:hypothetical protein
LKQIQPVNWKFNAVSELSSIPYHGHRFIGEYDDPKNRDINNPVVVFDISNPPS